MKFYIFLEHLYQLTRIPISIYSESGDFVKQYSVSGEEKRFFLAEEVREKLQLSRREDVLFYQYQNIPAAFLACKLSLIHI